MASETKKSRRLQSDDRLLVIVCVRADGHGYDVLEWGPGPERWHELEHHVGPGRKYTSAQASCLTPVGVLVQDVEPTR